GVDRARRAPLARRHPRLPHGAHGDHARRDGVARRGERRRVRQRRVLKTPRARRTKEIPHTMTTFPAPAPYVLSDGARDELVAIVGRENTLLTQEERDTYRDPYWFHEDRSY